MRVVNEGRKGSVSLGPVATTLLLPLILVCGGLIALCSIPYSKVAMRKFRSREDALRRRMRDRGRAISWSEMVNSIARADGTLLIEHTGFKGAVRVWWTPEDPRSLCPFPFEESRAESEETARWCVTRYTSDSGSAQLVETKGRDWTQIEGANLYQGVFGPRAVEILPLLRP